MAAFFEGYVSIKAIHVVARCDGGNNTKENIVMAAWFAIGGLLLARGRWQLNHQNLCQKQSPPGTLACLFSTFAVGVPKARFCRKQGQIPSGNDAVRSYGLM